MPIMPRRFPKSTVALLAAVCFGFAGPALAEELAVIGNATQLKPEAGARLDGAARALAIGADVYRDEQIWTASGGRLDIKFVDGSRVSLGENARMVLDAFVLPEAGGTGNQVLRSITGAVR